MGHELTPAQLALLIEAMDWRRTVAAEYRAGRWQFDRTAQFAASWRTNIVGTRNSVDYIDVFGNRPLPVDPEALRAFAADLQAELARKDIELAARAAEIHAKTLHIEKLKMQLAVLRRARFGRSSEKLDHDIEQLELLISELEEDVAAEDARAQHA